MLRVEDKQEPVRKLVHAANKFFGPATECVRRALDCCFVYLQDIADFVNKETHRSVGCAHNDVHGKLAISALGHFHATTHIHGTDDLATQVDETTHFVGGARNTCHFLVANHFLDAHNIDPKYVVIEIKGAKLSCKHVLNGGYSAALASNKPGSALFISAERSMSSATRPWSTA